jgi:membrane fusion protein, copper/silver efflux system
MKNISALIIGVVALLGVGVAGYWLGSQKPQNIAQVVQHEPAKKLLYYRNPMGLPGTSPVPKKDSMGMDYIPVFTGDEEAGNGKQVVLGIEKVQKLGVKSEPASLRTLAKTIRAAGRIEVDEKRTYTIAPKFEGWVERLEVNTSWQAVSKGQPLFAVYSPELISALREYALAAQGEVSLKDAGNAAKNSMQQLAAASLARLKNWGITEAQINEYLNAPIASDRDKRTLTFYAPISGIVLEKKAVQGMRFMPGEVLYQIADLSSVWAVADVAERDIAAVRVGSTVQVSVDAYPDKDFLGRIAFVYPTLNNATRTVQVRVELVNPNGLLKPAMFASVQIAVGKANKVLTVPTSAVIDSGTRQIVLVQLAEGRFEPRIVKLGSRSEDHVEVLEGIAEGEQVVTSANFLIDAESNLKAALSGMSGDSTPAPSHSQHEGH